MGLHITGLYAGLLGLLLVVLIGMVGRARKAANVSLGNAAGNRGLLVADRRHMNFVENVPMALLLIAIVEANGAPGAWVHGLGLALVAARLIHPCGLNPENAANVWRGIGAGVTMLVTLAAALMAIWLFVRG